MILQHGGKARRGGATRRHMKSSGSIPWAAGSTGEITEEGIPDSGSTSQRLTSTGHLEAAAVGREQQPDLRPVRFRCVGPEDDGDLSRIQPDEVAAGIDAQELHEAPHEILIRTACRRCAAGRRGVRSVGNDCWYAPLEIAIAS